LNLKLKNKKKKSFVEELLRMAKRKKKEVEYAKWDIRFLNLAEHIASWSLDPSTKVGSVIVDPQKRVISMGYNGLPRGIEDSDERLNNRDLKYKLIVHAERNSLLFARGSVEGCTIYTWPFQPCTACASMIIQAGIKRVVSLETDNPRWNEDFALSREILEEAGVNLHLFFGHEKKLL
jgi:dCMP deaminase